jgi:hypothetical protein
MGDVAGKNKRLGLETGGRTASGFGGLTAQFMNLYAGSKWGSRAKGGATGKMPPSLGGLGGGSEEGMWG